MAGQGRSHNQPNCPGSYPPRLLYGSDRQRFPSIFHSDTPAIAMQPDIFLIRQVGYTVPWEPLQAALRSSEGAIFRMEFPIEP